ncbi:hypothetical protein H7I76_17590 [Mycolicibacterium vaccae]|nr:hypothetical protein [Mycolicibacterium vaccae]
MQFMAAGQSMRGAAAQAVGLVKLTPHRVMRELYEQFIAYARAYAERIPKYTPADDNLAGAANSARPRWGRSARPSSMVRRQPAGRWCRRRHHPSRPHRWAIPPTPSRFSLPPALFVGTGERRWTSSEKIRPPGSRSIPTSRRSTGTRSKRPPTTPSPTVMNAFAGKLELLGRQSSNPIWQDLANLSAQYRRAFVVALPSYVPADNHLANAASYVSTTILGACAALGI